MEHAKDGLLEEYSRASGFGCLKPGAMRVELTQGSPVPFPQNLDRSTHPLAEKNMKLHAPALIASLLLLQPTFCPAKQLVTISGGTAAKMKKGKKLNLVWAAPGFDGTQGVKLGKISNETPREAGFLTGYLPAAFAGLVKQNSSYTLNLALTRLNLTETSFNASAQVELEGQVVDPAGAVVAAFVDQAEGTITSNKTDNARFAAMAIAAAVGRELFPSEFAPHEKKSPAVIVAAPKQPSSVIVLAPKKPSPVIVAPPAVSPAPAAASSPAAQGQATTIKPEIPTPAAGKVKPKANEPKAAPAAPLIPPAVAAQLKKGKGLDEIWISPAYDKAKGFSIGEVSYQVEERNDGIDKYLPTALAEIASPDAPCSLQLRIVQLDLRRTPQGTSSAKLKVEGVLTAKDGTLLAAFVERQLVDGTGDLVDDCRTATRKVVQAIAKTLR